MTTNYAIPNPKAVAALLDMIFDGGVQVAASAAADHADRHVATFLSDDDQLVALCACDKPFVIYTGTALSMIPPDVAKEMLRESALTPVVADNFYEVMNICSKLLMSETSSHLRLAKTLVPAEGVEALASLTADSTVMGFDVDVPRYGKGAIAFMIV